MQSLRALLAPAPAPPAAPAPWPPPPPRWALALLLQGLLLPGLLALLPPGLLLQPPPLASAVCALGAAHTAAQFAFTSWKDLAEHVLLGPRGASAGFYDGPPGQRAKRVAAAIGVAYLAYFTSAALRGGSGAAHFVAAAVAAATPLRPADAAAKHLERGLSDATMRARVWEWWWAS